MREQPLTVLCGLDFLSIINYRALRKQHRHHIEFKNKTSQGQTFIDVDVMILLKWNYLGKKQIKG